MGNNDNEDSGVDLGLFFGTNESYKEYKRKNQIADTEEDIREAEELERESEKRGKTGNLKTVLSKDTLTTIDDETMTMLRRTRCAHDYSEVFMQSSLDFYDKYYNETDVSQELRDARNIRRIYRDYTEYLYAIEVRNRYIDTLIDKYGGEDNFLKKLQMGMIKDWIPSIPKLSKRATDYDLFISGVIPTKCETLSDEEIEEFMKTLKEEGRKLDIECEDSIVESIGMTRLITEVMEEEYYRGGYSSGTSVKSLEDLNKIFRSWYKSDGGEKVDHQLFKNAPENIRKRFEEYRPYQEPGLLTRLMNGEEIEEPKPNPNEQVFDEVTNRTMTRAELERRQVIRFLASCGWSESRLLNYQNMSSSLDRMKRKTKARKKRRNNNDTGGDIEFMYGTSATGIDPIYSNSEDLMSALSNLMRGD